MAARLRTPQWAGKGMCSGCTPQNASVGRRGNVQWLHASGRPSGQERECAVAARLRTPQWAGEGTCSGCTPQDAPVGREGNVQWLYSSGMGIIRWDVFTSLLPMHLPAIPNLGFRIGKHSIWAFSQILQRSCPLEGRGNAARQQVVAQRTAEGRTVARRMIPATLPDRR